MHIKIHYIPDAISEQDNRSCEIAIIGKKSFGTHLKEVYTTLNHIQIFAKTS